MRPSHGRLHRRRDGANQVGKLVNKIAESNKVANMGKRDGVVIKTVYKTMATSIEGGIAGYTTVGAVGEPSKHKATQSASADDEDDDDKKKNKDEDDEEEEKKEKQKSAEATKTAEAPKTTKAVGKPHATSKDPEPETTIASKPDDDEQKDRGKKKTTESETEEAKTEQEATTESTKPSRTTKSTAMPTAISAPSDTDSVESTLARAAGHASVTSEIPTATQSDIAATAALADASSSADASASKSESSGTSAGAKAGIAFGVLGGLLVVGLLVWFLFNRRKKQAEQQRSLEDDEKLHGPIAGNASVHSSQNPFETAAVVNSPTVSETRSEPVAPRISLRPVTQFLPNWSLDKRSSKGAAMALGGAAASNESPATHSSGASAWDRPTTAQSADPANPFGQQAERVPSPIHEESTQTRNVPSSPVSPASVTGSDPLTANGPPANGEAAGMAAGAVAGAAAGAGAAALARKASMRKDGPKHLDLTVPNPPLDPVPASPAGTEFSNSPVTPGTGNAPSAGAAAIAAAGGPVNSTVHRVQLDFKATLDDEMSLKAGDLVRLLHEYDDGWALCIRLDRSQQGVVPRTCLSTRPVKPRPQGAPRPGPPVRPAGPPGPPGPPRGPPGPPGQRPMTPQGQRPMTPNGGRPHSPMGSPMGPPGGRSMSPGPRSQSPGPRPQSPGGRSQSPNGMNRRNSPPGPSPMNPAQGPPSGPVGRKPVPGQAY